MTRDFEVETLPGLETFAASEIMSSYPDVEVRPGWEREGRFEIRYEGDASRLNRLRSVVAVHRLLRFEVSRPRALLGHQTFHALLAEARSILAASPSGAFETLWISAAGSETAVFERLRGDLCEQLELTPGKERGDLLLAVRRSRGRQPGWEVLLRLTPRPLSARAWRVCDLPGALNATAAYAMATLTQPDEGQRFLNLACGSATLMIERLGLRSAARCDGVDIDAGAIACGLENLTAAGFEAPAQLWLADAARLPFPDACFDALSADLPFGMLMRPAGGNRGLYAAVLREAARVAVEGARFALITTDRRAIGAALADTDGVWRLAQTLPLKLPFEKGYLRASIYLLVRT